MCRNVTEAVIEAVIEAVTSLILCKRMVQTKEQKVLWYNRAKIGQTAQRRK